MSFTHQDALHMDRALELAARGDWRTGRNPKVGAVLARGAAIIAEGYHAVSGDDHAEAALFADLGERSAAGATLYVTLEPCGPQEGKRTPPCVEAVLAAKPARVVLAQLDPHPEVNGKSVERLRAAGIPVEVGLLEGRARRLNGPFCKWVTRGLPYVTAKWAMSLDGKIACASGDSQWISGEASRREVHVLRGEVGAVAVGIGTALADDPRLTRRDVPGGDPLRVVLDSRGRLPPSGKLASSARELPVLLATSAAADSARLDALRALGVDVLEVGEQRVDPARLLEALAARDVRHLLLEGGGDVLAGFLEAGAVDRVLAYVAPKIIGGSGAPGPVGGAGAQTMSAALEGAHLEARPSGADVRLEAHLNIY